MTVPFLLVLATLAQAHSTAPQTPAPASAAAMFATPFVVAEPNRLAITPVVDGKIDDEEWDPLGVLPDGSKTYFQWEPGYLDGAATVPTGHDAIFSFDMDANGWLFGKDNLEIRVSQKDGKASLTARILDATNVAGPTWSDLPGISTTAQVAASTDGTNVTYEFRMKDPGFTFFPGDAGDKIGIRVDDPQSAEGAYEAFYPRVVSFVTLGFQRAAGLPAGMTFAAEGVGKTYAAGERSKVRLTFHAATPVKLSQLAIRSEGSAKMDTNQLTVPFPNWDHKGRAYVDYDTAIKDSTTLGFRVIRGTVTAADGVPGIVQASYRIASAIDITLVPQPLPVAAIDRSIKFGAYIHSNSGFTLRGNFDIQVPEPLKLVNGNQRDFEVATKRGRLRTTFELFIPANTKGTIPVHFIGKVNGRPIDQTEFLTIGDL